LPLLVLRSGAKAYPAHQQSQTRRTPVEGKITQEESPALTVTPRTHARQCFPQAFSNSVCNRSKHCLGAPPSLVILSEAQRSRRTCVLIPCREGERARPPTWQAITPPGLGAPGPGPHGQVFVRGVEIPRIWGPGRARIPRVGFVHKKSAPHATARRALLLLQI